MTYCIYAIIDPRTDQVFYVGHSSSFKRRCEQHKKGQDSLSGLTIRQIKQNGFVPLFIRLENCPDKSAALMAEIFWIELFKSRGANLSNAQGFEGYEARASERKKQTRQLHEMTKAKDGAKGKAKKPRKTKLEKLEEIANGRPHQQGKSWSKRDDRLLLTLSKNGVVIEAIADRLGRSLTSIRMRLQALEKQN